MTDLINYEESTDRNNRIVQMALRDTDPTLLSKAAVAMSETERQIIFRNVSARAHETLVEEIARAETGTPAHIARKAKEAFLQKLHRYRDTDEPEMVSGEHVPEFRTASLAGIRGSITDLMAFARAHGMLALEAVNVENSDPIGSKGLQFVIDGWDPMEARQVLQTMKRLVLEREERRIDMLLEGIDAMLSGESPYIVRERLDAYLLSAGVDEGAE